MPRGLELAYTIILYTAGASEEQIKTNSAYDSDFQNGTEHIPRRL